MPRMARLAPGGLAYHVFNRGNNRQVIFHKPQDFAAFLSILGQAKQCSAMRVLGWCLMHNHFHLVLWPRIEGQLSAFMSQLCNTHVRRYRQHYHDVGQGHLYQGRFKSFAVQRDEHLLRVLRYVEANALRAGLVSRAEDWAYGSLWHVLQGNAEGLVDDWPVDRPGDWVERVNQPLEAAELGQVRQSLVRNRPLGQPGWVEATAKALNLACSLRPRGRPRKARA